MKLRTSFKRDAVPNDLTHLARALTAIGAHGTADDFGQAAGDTYEPFRLMDRKIILSDETLGAISQFEMLASRCDTLIGTSPLGTALARIMARMDGMFVAQLNGRRADYRLCCCLDFFKESGTAKGGSDEARLSALGLDLTPASVLSASKCAHQMETIELNSLCGAAPALITPGHVLALQQAIGRTFHPKVSSGLRTWDLPGESDEPDADAYRPPSPLELPEFLQDLVTFLNESPLGPSAKVALMHSQLEATKMFSSDTDQSARALLVGIWRNTGLIKYLMPPIAITPALARRNHDEVLRPYQFAPGLSEMQMIDNWVYHTACASQNAFEVAQYGYTIAHQTRRGARHAPHRHHGAAPRDRRRLPGVLGLLRRRGHRHHLHHRHQDHRRSGGLRHRATDEPGAPQQGVRVPRGCGSLRGDRTGSGRLGSHRARKSAPDNRGARIVRWGQTRRRIGRRRPLPYSASFKAWSSFWLMTLVTPSPCIDTPNRVSAISMVRRWWVIMMSWVSSRRLLM